MADSDQIRCLVLGGGGHARVLIESMQASQAASSISILDRDPALWGQELQDVPVLGGDDMLPELARDGVTHFVVGLGGVGDNGPRRRLFELATAHGLTPLSVVHPAATRSPWASLGDGSVVFPTAVVNAGAFVGRNVIVNTGAIVEHGCKIGDHAHLATGARLCSTVDVGVGAHVGAGATVRQSIRIGEGAIVGAGAVVVKDVAPWTVVVGVPGRILNQTRGGTAGPDRSEEKVPQ